MFLHSRSRMTLAVVAVLVTMCVVLFLAIPRARSALRIAPGFTQCRDNPRMFCESGAEVVADRFIDVLPAAVSRVEEKLGLPFPAEFRVYVPGSHESFARHIGHPASTPVRGIAFSRDVWVSPLAFRFEGRDTSEQTLAHELTHLYLEQHLGWWHRTRFLPGWFQEGLSDWVADTGLERMSRREAVESLRAGNRLTPDATGHLPFTKGADGYGVTWPAYHAQSRLFIEYLHDGREERFRALMLAVLQGEPFDEAFRESYGCTLASAWEEFLGSLSLE